MQEHLYIEEVAKRMGLTPRTLRFWEEKGLLCPPTRTEGGLRLYTEADIARLIRIRELRDLLGLSLDVIGELLRTEDEIEQLRAQAKQAPHEERLQLMRRGAAILETQIRMMADRTARLQQLQQSYEQRLERLRVRLRQEENELAGGADSVERAEATHR